MASIFGPSRLPTGIDALDRELDGGIPSGSVVAYSAPPTSQSELLLYELTTARDTLYLTTDRSEDAVRDAFERAQCPTGDPEIHGVPIDDPLDSARQLFRTIDDEANLVIDPIDILEHEDRARYQRFLNELQTHMVNTGAVSVLHCLTGDAPSLRRTTEHMADVVFDLQVDREGTDLEAQLAIPKFRGGEALTETVKLNLGDRIRVDTSRDIA